MNLDPLRVAAANAPRGHRTLAEKAFATLHEAVVTGVLRPGEVLPIDELTRTLDMSSIPIREALRQLDTVGLVEHVPHRTARVTDLSIEELVQIYEARLALEPLAIRCAAARFTAADRRTAHEALERQAKALADGDSKRAWIAHGNFHFALYEASGSRWLPRLIKPLWESSERYRLASHPIRDSLVDRRTEHARILETCVRHDPGRAARELYDHLARTANAIAESMGREAVFT